MEHWAYIPALAIYGALSFFTLLPGVFKSFSKYALPLVLAAVASHSIAIGLHLWRHTFSASLPDALSAASLGLMVWYASRAQARIKTVIVPLALVLLATALVVPSGEVAALTNMGVSPWLPLHLGLMFAGLAGCAWSFVVGIAYLLVRWHLKNRRFDALGSLPSLEILDRNQYKSTLFGFTFLTLGIGVGGLWAATTLAEPWFLDAKVVFTLLVWAWYGITLVARHNGVTGRWGAAFSIIGFSGMIFSILFVNLLVSGWHGVR